MRAIRKHLRIWAGFLLLLAGAVLALPLVPGPGFLLMLLGLALLSEHFTWANRCLAWARRKWQHLRTQGEQP